MPRAGLYLSLSVAACALTGQVFAQAPEASFFVTSENPGSGGDLGGLSGADAHCQSLAAAAGMGDKTWRAYLSTSDVDARDRIGDGPWYNVDGVLIAQGLDELHDNDRNRIGNESAVDENGDAPPYFVMVDGEAQRPDGLAHDILTGTNADGTANEATCNDWTDGSADSTAMLGHADRIGRDPGLNSWNAIHASRGCDIPSLEQSGGAGLFYCFAVE